MLAGSLGDISSSLETLYLDWRKVCIKSHWTYSIWHRVKTSKYKIKQFKKLEV